ncbi:MAG TPA: exosortase/archaeosortase family protein [Chthoniobacterales bacterium]
MASATQEKNSSGRWFAAGTLAVVLLYGWSLFLWHLSVFWRMLPDYAYGWAVPVLTLILLGRRRHALGPPAGLLDPQTALATAFLTLLYLPLRIVLDANLDWRPAAWVLAALVVVQTLLLVHLVGGPRWSRWLAFPLLFTLTGVPWLGRLEIPITTGLMHFGAFVATEVLNALGVAADQRGNVIETTAGFIGVDEACSGIKSLQTMVMIGFFLSDFTSWRGWRRVLVVLAGGALATTANLLRILVLALVGSRNGQAGIEGWHDVTGTLAFAAACAGLLFLVRQLPAARPAVVSPGAPRSTPRPVRPSVIGCGAFAAVFLAGTEVVRWHWFREAAPVASSAWTVTWPDHLEARVVHVSSAVRQQLQCDQGDAMAWSNEPGTRWIGYYFTWNPGLQAYFARSQHAPEICLPATGRRLTADAGYFDFPAPVKVLRVRHLVFDDEAGPLNVFFIVDGSAVRDTDQQLHSDTWRVRLGNVMAHKKEADRRSLELIAAGYAVPEEAAEAAKRWLRTLIQPEEKGMATGTQASTGQ